MKLKVGDRVVFGSYSGDAQAGVGTVLRVIPNDDGPGCDVTYSVDVMMDNGNIITGPASNVWKLSDQPGAAS